MWVRSRNHPVKEAPHEDVLQGEEAGGALSEGVQRTRDSREGLVCTREAWGSHVANMGQPEAEGQRRVAPCHPAARLLLPGVHAGAGNRLQPATAHPVRGRQREGVVRSVRDVAPWHGAKLYPLRTERGRHCAYRGGGGRAGMTGSMTEVAPCPNIS